MRKVILFLILSQISLIHYGQIIADHRIVADYDKIPQYYIDEVKKMMIWFAGESHAYAYRDGLTYLETADATYSSSIWWDFTEYFPPYGLRAIAGMSTYGEDKWFTWKAYTENPPDAKDFFKNQLDNQKTKGNPINVLGFAWCYDMVFRNISTNTDGTFGTHWMGESIGGPDGNLAWGLNAGDNTITGNRVSMDTYLAATEDYISYVTTSHPKTKVVFTTGPVDYYNTGESGYQIFLKNQYIRDYVATNSTRILFDYADILCYDNDGTLTTESWNGHVFPIIAPPNFIGDITGHIGSVGAMRLAKAMWWMLARIAGWDGITTDIKKNESSGNINVFVDNNADEIRVYLDDSFMSGQLRLFNLQGHLISESAIKDKSCIFNKSTLTPGVYIVKVNKLSYSETRKMVVLN